MLLVGRGIELIHCPHLHSEWGVLQTSLGPPSTLPPLTGSERESLGLLQAPYLYPTLQFILLFVYGLQYAHPPQFQGHLEGPFLSDAAVNLGLSDCFHKSPR